MAFIFLHTAPTRIRLKMPIKVLLKMNGWKKTPFTKEL